MCIYLIDIDVENGALDDEEYLDGVQNLSLKHTFYALSEVRRRLALTPHVSELILEN